MIVETTEYGNLNAWLKNQGVIITVKAHPDRMNVISTKETIQLPNPKPSVFNEKNTRDIYTLAGDTFIFADTGRSCIAKIENGEYTEVWKPPFVTQDNYNDLCHLNGLAIEYGQPKYVTAFTWDGLPWRGNVAGSGVIVDVASGEVLCDALTAPHSPRSYQDKLWVLNSGTCEFGYIQDGKLITVAFCPGFARGLDFIDHYAVIGISEPRPRQIEALAKAQEKLTRGVLVVDINTHERVGVLSVWNMNEIYDVEVARG